MDIQHFIRDQKTQRAREKALLDGALARFRELTGIAARMFAARPINLQGLMYRADGRLRIDGGNGPVEFNTEVTGELRAQHVDRLVGLSARGAAPLLVVSPYISLPVKRALREQALNYLEASGNCFLRQDGLLIYVNDQAVTPARVAAAGKLWKPAGLKFLFPILLQPQLLNAPYRTMATAARVALGNVGAFVEELKREQYAVVAADGGLFIEHMERLRQKWVEHFPTQLRPRLKPERFRFARPVDWKTIPAKHFRWGGEAAGALLTKGYLKPERLSLYTFAPRQQIMKELRLVPDADGPLEVLDAFWDETAIGTTAQHAPSVPPLLAYADLAGSLDSRNRETADRIYAQYLQR